MGIRAYLGINLKNGVQPKKADEIIQKIDALNEVDFLDAVNGPHDLIAMVEAPITVKTVMEKIKSINGVDNIQSYRILGIHKEW